MCLTNSSEAPSKPFSLSLLPLRLPPPLADCRLYDDYVKQSGKNKLIALIPQMKAACLLSEALNPTSRPPVSLETYYEWTIDHITAVMESAHLCCYVGSITNHERPKNGQETRQIYIKPMLECWKHDWSRMPRGTWSECTLWLNIRVSRPAIGGLLATQGDERSIAHLDGRMRLFENSIPVGGLFMGEFLHTHTILNPACPSLNRSTPLGNTTAFSLPYSHQRSSSECWLVTPYLWLSKRREVYSPPTVCKTT